MKEAEAEEQAGETPQDVADADADSSVTTGACGPVSQLAYYIIRLPWFDPLITVAILVNCVFMASEDPAADCDKSNPQHCGSYQRIIADAELSFFVIFLVECVLKICGLGFRRYIGDPWNRIDFLVVVVSFSIFVPGGGNLQALRTLRLLRTLRTVAKVKSMKRVVGVLLKALPLLSEVLLLVAFVILVLAVLFMFMFMGTLRNHCFNVVNGTWSYPDTMTDSLCGGEASCGAEQVCRKAPSIDANPNVGVTNYDHIGFALLTIFQLTTAEGWTEIMYWQFDTTGYWTVFPYLVVIIIGALVAISIAFAALENVWGDLDDEEGEAAGEGGDDDRPLMERAVDGLFGLPCCRPLACINIRDTGLGQRCKRVADAEWFDVTVFNAILINTVCLAAYRSDISTDEEDAYRYVNYVLTGFFAVEATIRICGYNLSGYLRDPMNAFDGTIVVLSIIEAVTGSGGIISVFRALRLLRVLRYLKRWRSLNNLLSGMVRSIQAVSALTMVMVLFLFIFALIGKEFFGKEWDGDAERYNYDDIWWALYSVFVTFTGENWNAQMYDGMRQKGNGWAVYFLLIIVVGNYIILNLFIAIMLDNLQAATEEDNAEGQEEASVEALKGQARLIELQAAAGEPELSREQMVEAAQTDAAKQHILALGKRFDYFDTNGNGWIDEQEMSRLLAWCNIKLSMMEFSILFADDKFTFSEFITLMDQYGIQLDELEDPTGGGAAADAPLAAAVGGLMPTTIDAEGPSFTPAEVKILEDADLDPAVLVTPEMGTTNRITMDPARKSLWVFGVTNPFRRLCARIAENEKFNQLILLCILVSTVLVALDEPRRSKDFRDNLDLFDRIFTYIFIFELVVKVVAMGFFYDTGVDSYWFSSNFNKLDFVIILISVVALFPAGSEVGALKALRAFRALRPLRAVGQFDSLKVVMNAMMQSFVPMLYGLGFFTFFLFIFAVFGTHFFAGKFHYCRTVGGPAANFSAAWPECPSCDDPVLCRKADCHSCWTAGDDGVRMGEERIWDNYVQNFDNVGHSMVVLFEMTTLEAWPSIALYGVDATGKDTWPKECTSANGCDMGDQSHWYMWYFILFTMLVTFFVAQIFAGVVCDKFDRLTSFYDGTLFLTEKQRTWWFDAKDVVKARPTMVTYDPMVKELLHVATHPYLDAFIGCCIGLNLVVLCMYTEDMTQDLEDTLETLNLVFFAIFAGELVLKVMGMGLVAYFNDRWNDFDAFVVALSVVTMIVDVGPVALVLRVLRVFKLLSRFESLMSVVMTMIYAVPAIMNVGLLMVLFLVIFAALGVGLFGKTVRGDFLAEYANFETFPIAMLTLFRVSTGEDWNGMMYDCALQEGEYNSAGEQCTAEADNCGVNGAAQVYFIVFNLLSAFVLLNMVVGAVLMAFDASRMHFKEGITQHMVNTYKQAWYKLDPAGDARIAYTDFNRLYRDVAPAFGLPLNDDAMQKVLRKCETVVDPVGAGEEGQDDGEAGPGRVEELKFSDVLYVFAFEAFGTPLMSSKLAQTLETLKTKQEKRLDGDLETLSFKKKGNDMRHKPLPRLTEKEMLAMDEAQLMEELRKRGAVRAARPDAGSISLHGL